MSSGIQGLDEVLRGGFVDHRGYLIRGGPGTGKTTLGMHFLAAGIARGESSLFITLGESEANLRANACQIGLNLESVRFLDLSPRSDFFSGAQSYDLFSPAEVDRDPVTRKIVECVLEVKPKRVFLDSTSHLRYLSIDSYQFRKQFVAFTRFLLEQNAIVVFTSEGSSSAPDDDVMYLSDGVINLKLHHQTRTLEVSKFRGSDFMMGPHTLVLTRGGAEVHPRLIPYLFGREFKPDLLKSGIAEIDALLHGGLETGTVSVLTGPPGVGKTSLALQFACEAARDKKRTTYLSFEESTDSLLYRGRSIQMPLDRYLSEGLLKITSVEPLLYSADQISSLVRHEVEVCGTKLLVLDGVAGYRIAVSEDLGIRLRALFRYLTNMGVSVVAVNDTEAITGDFRATEVGISYMADNLVFLRYLELNGELRKAIGVLKKRLGDFERQLREYAITKEGIRVGAPLVNLRGVLTGVPEWVREVLPNELIHQD